MTISPAPRGLWIAALALMIGVSCDQRILRYQPGSDAGLDAGDAGPLEDGGEDGGEDAGLPDGGDGGVEDAGFEDAGEDAGFDAGIEDAGIPAVLGVVSPSLGYLRQGQAGMTTFPQPFTVTIQSVVDHDTFIGVTSGNPAALVVVDGGVVVPEGQTSAVVLFNAQAQSAPILVTASLNGGTGTGNVRVLGTTEQGTLISLEPDAGFFSAGDVIPMTVAIDLPANGAQQLFLGVSPDAGTTGEVPPSVTIPADQFTATFDFVSDAGVRKSAQVLAQQGSTLKTAWLSLRHLVISEVSPGTATTATDEFVELYNPTSTPIDLSNWRLQYKSGNAGSSFQDLVQLPAPSSIAAHGYFLIGLPTYTGPTADYQQTTGNSIGAAAGVVRIGPQGLTTAHPDPLTEDLVGWGTGAGVVSEGGAAPTLQTSSNNSIERKALFTSTAATMTDGGAESALGNGWDTDRNAQDFVVRSVRDPQNSASPAEP